MKEIFIEGELQGNRGMVVLDEEEGIYVQIKKKDVEKWVKEAITDLYKEE